MKLVTFEAADGVRRPGVIDGEEIVPIDAARHAHALRARRSIPPTRRSPSERTRSPTSACTRRSSRRSSSTPPATSASTRTSRRTSNWSHEIAPWIVFFQNVDAIIGPDEPIIYPEHLTDELDYELELAVIIGRAGKHFDADEAADYIGGYMIFNDITARDIQRREMRSGVFSFCKAIDTFCPLGPVDRHARRDRRPARPRDAPARQRRAAPGVQHSHMSVTIPQILAHYSALGYSAGDVVSTGTVSGVAGFRENAAEMYLQPGRRRRVRDRADRHAPQPGDLLGGGLRRAGAAAAW